MISRRLVLIVTFLFATLLSHVSDAQTTTVMDTQEKKKPFVTSSDFVKFMFGGDANKSAAQPQPMLVIGAGYGRTGTSSFTVAMHRLGLNPYHMKEGVVMTPGQLDLWNEHARLRQAGEAGLANEILDSIAQHGFNASNNFPLTLLTPEMVKRYPNARVVLTVRSDGDGNAWATSMLGSVMQIVRAVRRVPFCWIPRLQKFQFMVQWFKGESGFPDDPATGMPRREDLAKSYNDWVAHVQTIVPRHRLLVFAAKDGWEPLCDFLTAVNEIVARNCQELLAAGESYPRVNEKAFVQRIIKGMSMISFVFETIIPCMLLTVLGRLWWQATQEGKVKKKQG